MATGQILNAEMFKQGTFFRVPKILLSGEKYEPLSSNAKILYAIFQDRAELSLKNRWLDENGDLYFLFSVAELCFFTGWSAPTVRKAREALIQYELLEVKTQGNNGIDKTYLRLVDSETYERKYLSNKEMIRLFNLYLYKTASLQSQLTVEVYLEQFTDFAIQNCGECITRQNMEDLLKLHKDKFIPIFRVLEQHIGHNIGVLMRKIKYLEDDAKKKSKFRAQWKKEFESSLKKLYTSSEVMKNQLSLPEYIKQIEQIWCATNAKAIQTLEEAEQKYLEKSRGEKNFPSKNLKTQKALEADSTAEKTWREKNFLPEEKDSFSSEEKNFDPSHTKFSHTDLSETDKNDDESIINKTSEFFETEAKKIVEEKMSYFPDQTTEDIEIRAEVLKKNLLPVLDVFETIDRLNLPNEEHGGLTKQTLLSQLQESSLVLMDNTVPFFVTDFREAWKYTKNYCQLANKYDQYMAEHLRLIQEQRSVLVSELAGVQDFFIPMDGPWNGVSA